MRILVCGAGGQVGREVIDRAAGFGLQILPMMHRDLDIARADDVARVFATLKPQLVINTAAFTRVDDAETHADQAYAINRDGAANLAQAAEAVGIPLFHLSTDYVFSGEAGRPYTEDDPTGPTGIYGASKLAGEQAIRQQCQRHLILRTSWVYGRYGSNFVKTMLRLGAQRDQLSIVADQVGCPTHAGSLAEVMLTLASRYARGEELAWGLYHYCGQPACSWFDFAVEVFRQAEAHGLLGRQPVVAPISSDQFPTAARRPAWSVLDCRRFEQAFAIAPHDWLDDLAQVVGQLAADRHATVPQRQRSSA